MSTVAVAITVAACGGRAEPKRVDGDDVGAYLPDNPDLVVRIDLDRVRSWPAFAKLSQLALAPLTEVTTFVRSACGLDLLTEAKTLLIARQGAWRTGDVTIAMTGLRALESCRAKLGAANPLVFEGGLYRVQQGGMAIASGKQLGDQLIFVQRAGQALDAATWSALAARRVAPAWWSQLDRAAPIAARSATAPRIIYATVEPGDPLTVRARLTSESAETAVRDQRIVSALAQYFEGAGAGTLKAEVAGTTVKADLTATGPQIEHLIDLARPTLFGTPAPLAAAVDCQALALAVEQYLTGALKKAAEVARPALEARTRPLLLLLPKVFVDACAAGNWSQDAIRCHVESAAATALTRFERCREQLTPAQLAPLDAATVTAMKAATKS